MTGTESGIVLELQRDCLDESISVNSLLRKAKVIAAKLELEDLKAWIDSELNGYECPLEEIPEHRKGIGQPKFNNPYHGWCPIMVSDDWFGQTIRTVYLRQSVSELETLISDKESGQLVMYYNPSIQGALQKQLPVRMECALHFSKSEIVAALAFVRNKMLDWTLELEQRGIFGKGLSFGDDQKKDAQVVTNHIYGGNFGVLGSVAGDAKNSGFMSVGGDLIFERLREIIPQIREAIPALPSTIQSQVTTLTEKIETETAARNPSQPEIRKTMGSLKTVLEGAAGNLTASSILAAIATIVG
ncbi:MAG: hypothetical protein J7499_09505 [Sphingopyxis sp.]|nr:hypothetical protein [Sphingopyxis sp.]